MVAASPVSRALHVLVRYDFRVSVYVAFVAAHLPLSEQQWGQLAAWRRRHLAKALPAALEHSPAQARQLVRLLSDARQARLRTFGLSLARLQRRLQLPLPGLLAGKLMALFDA